MAYGVRERMRERARKQQKQRLVYSFSLSQRVVVVVAQRAPDETNSVTIVTDDDILRETKESRRSEREF